MRRVFDFGSRQIPPDPTRSRSLARIAGSFSQAPSLIGANDLLIAAHARAVGATLVTNNEAEFRRVPDLKVVNWLAES